MLGTPYFHCKGTRLIPGQGTKIPTCHMTWPRSKQNLKIKKESKNNRFQFMGIRSWEAQFTTMSPGEILRKWNIGSPTWLE